MPVTQMSTATLTASVIVVGLVVVFLVLILLAVLINVLGRIFRRVTNKEKPAKQEDKPAPVSYAPAVVVTPPSTKQDVDDEVLAVIAAAVAAYSQQTGVQYTVRKVSRSKGRSLWGFAALRHNTNPF